MSEYGSVGRYRLIRPLAQGGMAEIFLAKQEGPAGFGKTVVVKRVLSHLANDTEFIHMFLDEARLAAQLSHPNVVQVFDFGQEDNNYFLAMEYLSGEDLSEILRALRDQKRVMPSQIASVIVSLACEGLNYAHTLPGETGEPLGIVHRDVSPSNIMVTFQGAVKVLDFGIAKAAGKIVKTEAGMVKGKFMYMSPEQARGRSVDRRSDVFALGAVLYEMVTGIRVFQRDNQLAMLLAVTEDPIKPPKELQPDIPEELQAIIMRALERDVDRRFPSCQAMREAVDDFLADRTYAPSHVQLKQFLTHLFGEQHVRERSRPPALSTAGPAKPKTPSHPSAGVPSQPAAPSVPPTVELMLDESTAEGIQDEATRIGQGVTGPTPTVNQRDQATRIGAPPSATPPPGGADMDGATRIQDLSEIRPTAVPRVGPPDELAELDMPARKSKTPFIAGGVAAAALVGGILFTMTGPEEDVDPSNPTPMVTRPTQTAPTPDPTPDPTPVAVDPPPDPVVEPPDPVVEDPPPPTPDPVVEPVAETVKPPVVATRRDRPPRVRPGKGRWTGKPKGTGKIKKPRDTKVAAAGGTGRLSVNCIPWCKIYLDGKDTGRRSPARGIPLSAGTHRLRVVHPPNGMERFQDVKIQADQDEVAVIRF